MKEERMICDSKCAYRRFNSEKRIPRDSPFQPKLKKSLPDNISPRRRPEPFVISEIQGMKYFKSIDAREFGTYPPYFPATEIKRIIIDYYRWQKRNGYELIYQGAPGSYLIDPDNSRKYIESLIATCRYQEPCEEHFIVLDSFFRYLHNLDKHLDNPFGRINWKRILELLPSLLVVGEEPSYNFLE